MRFKLSVFGPALLAVSVFVAGLIIMLGLSLSVDDGEFVINLSVPTIGIYLALSLIAATFVFRLWQKK